MREIKFRGKRKDNGEWVYGYYFVTNTTDFQDDKGNICNKCHFIYTNTAHSVIPETVGQYTGLKDKNGKKIYEGDNYKEGERIWTVIWGAGMFLTDYANGSGQKFINYADIEIIGNIHDNPELLEQK